MDKSIIELLKTRLDEMAILSFSQKPILIGGLAMEYYGLRKAGSDIDLVICNEDYHSLAEKYPKNRKDIWGDLGVVIGPFEIWRCIMLLDYDFYLKGAIEEEYVYVVSMEKLTIMRIFGIEISKYYEDLKLIGDYYVNNNRNKEYLKEAEKHFNSYKNSDGGVIYGGKYID
ncbi:hypothetical protein FACS1894142_2900 [Spirochaetia bacterium]|nr:hypothetical protein FACS1894142_2900 [Spirochaetia bacterium]